VGTDPGNIALAMLAVFGSAKLLAEVFERLRQPGIVGEILAGVLIGPAVLGWVTPSPILTTLADLGVMFLLFRVGLETHPRQLRKVGPTALLVALLGVLALFVLGWLVMALWGKPRIESIFVGAALVATSVGITAQILSTRGLLSHRASRVILAAAVIDDVLGFMLLGVVSAVAREHVRVPELILSGALAAGFTAIIAGFGSRTVIQVFPRVQRNLRAGEVQFNVAMVAMFGLVLVAAWTGVAALIGAFLAGMAFSESLEERVHTLSSGVSELLTPFFLVGIGLHLDLRALADVPTLTLASVITVIAVVSKLFGCGLGALGLGRANALRVGAGMVPRGEVGMVVAQIGLRMNVISPGIYGAVVLVAVITTLIAPVMLHAAFRGVDGRRPESIEEFTIR
jgi:Kef-type K+ transport system membrane component KefB